MKKNPAVILCYTLRTTKYNKKTDKEESNYQDFWEIFCEEDEMECSEINQAKNRLGELQNMYDEGETELYTWNIALVADTSDHYNTL